MSRITLFDEAGLPPSDPRNNDLDLDRLVWDPEYRADIQRSLRVTPANDDTPPPRPLRTVA